MDGIFILPFGRLLVVVAVAVAVAGAEAVAIGLLVIGLLVGRWILSICNIISSIDRSAGAGAGA